MSRPIRTVIVALIVVAVVVCFDVLPKMWKERLAHDAAQNAAQQAAQDSARQVAHDAVRDMAKEISDRLLNQPTTQPATMPTIDLPAISLERADYSIHLPGSATIDPQDAGAGQDRYTAINLPNRATMIILAMDRNDAADALMRTQKSLESKLKNLQTRPAEAFDRSNAKQTTAITGFVGQEPFGFELGQYDGEKSACVVIVEYHESERAATSEMAQKALKTLVIKR